MRNRSSDSQVFGMRIIIAYFPVIIHSH